MFYVERSGDDGEWTMMMASPHRVGIDDLHGPPGPHSINHHGGGDLHKAQPTPGNKGHFSGRTGSEARVRYNDTIIERYAWALIPKNDLDPESPDVWGWKLVEEHRSSIPFEKLYPMSFLG